MTDRTYDYVIAGGGTAGCVLATRLSEKVRNLRVVDASAMPKLPTVNPNITVMTMAERCADLIRTAR